MNATLYPADQYLSGRLGAVQHEICSREARGGSPYLVTNSTAHISTTVANRLIGSDGG